MSESVSPLPLSDAPPSFIISLVQQEIAARCIDIDPAAQPISDQAVSEQIQAFEPGDAVEALIAGQMLIAHHGSSACFRKARQHDPGSAKASRLRRDGIAQQRLLLAAARLLLKPRRSRQKPAAAAPKRAVPRLAFAAPPPETRDPASANASPPQVRAPRWEELTMEQRREYYGYKDPPPKAEKKT